MTRTAALSIDDFALFARVAELRNLSAVARERDVPPSQVSRALARIEQQCGVRLVHRSTHGLSLTEEGDSLAAHGAQVLAVAQQLDAELDTRRGEVSGLVRVATSPTMALHLLAGLGTLLDRHPRLRLELSASDRLADIAHEGIDIAIRTGTPTQDGLVARTIGEHARAVYAAPAYLARRGTPQHPDDLPAHTLIANSASPVLNRWRFVVDGAPRELRVEGTLRTDNTGIAMAMALAGLGVARLNVVLAAPHVQAGRLRPLLEPFIERVPVPIYAVMLPDRQRLPKVRACLEHFATWFGAAPPSVSIEG
jgi:DNA-binding transcriptional LysR family regulator